MAGKLRETANIKGGRIEGCALVDAATFIVDQLTDHPPSYYRGLATAQGSTFAHTYQVARTTVGAGGSSTIGALRVRAPLGANERVVQHFISDEDRQRRASSSESSWTPWRPDVAKAIPGWSAATGSGGSGGFAANSISSSALAEQVASLINSLIEAGVLEEAP